MLLLGEMKKLALFIVLLVLVSTLTYAKGGSSGGSVVKPKVVAPPDCESFDSLRERIQCRLENGQAEETVPEPCRVVAKQEQCTAYYRTAVSCYEKQGMAKDKCLKQKAGFVKKSVREQLKGNENKWPVELYVVALLYDLEEKIEDAVDDKKLSAADGAKIIEDIVEVKILVLNGEPVFRVKSAVQGLRTNWPEGVE